MTINYVFRNGKDLLNLCEKHSLPIWEVMLRYEMQVSTHPREEIWDKLLKRLKVIFDGIDAAIDKPELSPSGMVGKNTPILAKHVAEFKEHADSLLLNEAAIRAMLGADRKSVV